MRLSHGINFMQHLTSSSSVPHERKRSLFVASPIWKRWYSRRHSGSAGNTIGITKSISLSMSRHVFLTSIVAVHQATLAVHVKGCLDAVCSHVFQQVALSVDALFQ